MAQRTLRIGGVALGIFAFTGSWASAHADVDFVAVPAGEETVVRLRPNHGCGDSPTIEVRVRAPIEDAVPVDVEGWTSSSKLDGEGHAILQWVGGELPSDEIGAFPVEFVVPDTPGEMLVFPAIQRCANGEELAWIDGDPEADYPAPRLLVLPAGSDPAETFEDVPLDAPGRDLLLQIIDVNPTASSVPSDSSSPDATPHVLERSTPNRGKEFSGHLHESRPHP